MGDSALKIALVSPYHGGSHKRWTDGLCQNSRHHITLHTLPASHWKWRMQGAAISMAKQLEEQEFDLILTTDMINVGLLRSLLSPADRTKPIALYFHENQFAYPVSPNDKDRSLHRDQHYGFINYSSALAADQIWFNSAFNRDSFLEGAGQLLHIMPDHQETQNLALIRQKSAILPLGVSFESVIKPDGKRPRILWNHRWEHDKNPAVFESLVDDLISDHDFEIVVAGDIRLTDRERLQGKWGETLIHCGFIQDYEKYLEMVASCSIMPVTSHHDFFGESVVTAIHHGVTPLLPNRLSYPEIFPFPEYFYQSDQELKNRMTELLLKPQPIKPEHLAHIQRYSWPQLIGKYDSALEQLVR